MRRVLSRRRARITVRSLRYRRRGRLFCPILALWGATGWRGRTGLYQVETVVEKPTPTEAEQRLVASGLRAGHYLCFFGIHVLTATVMEILGGLLSTADAEGADGRPGAGLYLSAALNLLAQREQYLALEQRGMRLDIGVKYGLLTAQIALALNGQDRDEMLTRLLELLMARSMQEGEEPI